jgi:signal transduction histidine kinase
VFDNLFSNALKYARPGEPPSIVIRSHIDRSVVCFSVSDRGIGIPVDQRTRVFQPFVRLRQTEVPGSGIGLAIVRRIVEFYGGQVWIEDSEAPGCTVKFTLPRLGDVRCETDPADPVSPSQKVFDVSGSSKL